MKLKMSLPERPGWIFVIPGFDFVALLLALVMLTGVVAKESYVEIKLARSEFRGERLEGAVVVMLESTANGPVYYVGAKQTSQGDLGQAIYEAAEKRGTKTVAIKVDRDATISERQVLVEIITELRSFRILEGYRKKDR